MRANPSQEFYKLEGKLRRTVYAIVWQDATTNFTLLDGNEEEMKKLMKGIKSAIIEARENALEFLIENKIVKMVKKKKRTR